MLASSQQRLPRFMLLAARLDPLLHSRILSSPLQSSHTLILERLPALTPARSLLHPCNCNVLPPDLSRPALSPALPDLVLATHTGHFTATQVSRLLWSLAVLNERPDVVLSASLCEQAIKVSPWFMQAYKRSAHAPIHILECSMLEPC